jgi:outer membrane protein TolC
LALSQLSRRSLEIRDSLADAERRVQSTFSIAESSKVQRAYREKAAQELNRAYTQGRSDINTLITSLNNYFDSEIQYSKAIGDYQTALNEWAAARDELIPDLK